LATKTHSETLFEAFCDSRRLPWASVPVGAGRVPDYQIITDAGLIFVEIKQIESTAGVGTDGTWHRSVGSHVRAKIDESRGQIQSAARYGSPAVLLIYNAVDPLQMFGTEQLDFIAAMYGELTISLIGKRLAGTYHGRNSKLRHDANTSFSAVGHLRSDPAGGAVVLYENAYAKHPLPYDALPMALEVIRVTIEDAA